MLGRCCRRVLLCDARKPRNARSHALHGFLTRDGIPPAELRRIAREELRRYDTVEVRDVDVVAANRRDDGFALVLADGTHEVARTLLLATGVVDELPPLTGLAALWGRSVFPCPYCDAWEFRGRRLGVLGRGDAAMALARSLTGWSRDVIIFSDGDCGLSGEQQSALGANDVRIVCEPIEALEGDEGNLRRLVLSGAPAVERDALFVSGPQHQRSRLVEQLGCRLNSKGIVETGECESTNAPGVFVAGDASEGVQLAIIAAAEGAQAAFAIHRSLVRAEFAAPAA